MAKILRLEKLNVVKYCSNPVKIATLQEDGFSIVEDIRPPKVLETNVATEQDGNEVEENTETDVNNINYKFDDMNVEQIKKILDEKGIEYDKKSKKEVLFALLV